MTLHNSDTEFFENIKKRDEEPTPYKWLGRDVSPAEIIADSVRARQKRVIAEGLALMPEETIDFIELDLPENNKNFVDEKIIILEYFKDFCFENNIVKQK